MATIRYFPSQGTPAVTPLHKPLTTVGRALGNDVHLPDATVSQHHAQIVFNGRDFQMEEVDKGAEILVNGKKKRRFRLVHGDRLTLGQAQLAFSIYSDAVHATDAQQASGANEIGGLRKLHGFSQRLMSSNSVDELLETLLDDVIELTGAARGIVLLVAPGADKEAPPEVKASRNVMKEAIQDPDGGISDSIVQQVIENKRAVIVSDALSDTAFGKSESVIALKLSSVMCAPLLSQGEVIGA